MFIFNPVILYCVAPAGAGAAGVQWPDPASRGCWKPLPEVPEPADLGKVDGTKSKPGLPEGEGDGQVSRRGVWKNRTII